MKTPFDCRTIALFLAVAVNCAAARGADRKVELIWPDGAPGAVGETKADKPQITHWPATGAKATKAAVIVCPGGGYGAHALDHEGKQIAEWLNARGVSAYVLEYRLGPRYRHPAPLQDAQRAIRIVRSRAGELGLAADKIGIWGFSAGGHLASTAATHFDAGNPNAKDPIQKVSCRPDFAILCYPVITLVGPYAHVGSRNNLLGPKPDAKLVESLCNEKQVTALTPPTFLFHTAADTGVPPENSIMFFMGLRKAKVPCELHIYERGPHGVGLAQKDPVLSSWPDRLHAWLDGRGLLRKK